jgi:hypothetical protein
MYERFLFCMIEPPKLRTGSSKGRISSPGGVKNIHFSKWPKPALGFTQPLMPRIPMAFSPRIKRPERRTNHSHSTSAEVKKRWIYTSTPQYAFMDYWLVKHKNNFTLRIHPNFNIHFYKFGSRFIWICSLVCRYVWIHYTDKKPLNWIAKGSLGLRK